MEAPSLGSTVVLAVPELGTFRARVVSALDGQIVLLPHQRPTAPLLLLRYDATFGRAGASSDDEGVVGTITRRGERWLFVPSQHQSLSSSEGPYESTWPQWFE